MRIAACGSDVDGLCRCHEHCRAARDRIAARSDRDRGTLSLPPSYIRLISPASASAMVRRQGQNELQQVQRGSTSGRLRKSTSMMASHWRPPCLNVYIRVRHYCVSSAILPMGGCSALRPSQAHCASSSDIDHDTMFKEAVLNQC